MAQHNEPNSIYKVLAIYIQQAQKFGNYIKGYIDGKDTLENFIKEYSEMSNTKFIVRSSCKKSKQFSNSVQTSVTNCSRYGQTDRIYWEFNNRNLYVPFTGTPFVINSSQVKQCQYGAQYYKLKAEKCKIKNQSTTDSWNALGKDSFDQESPDVIRRCSARPTKKRNCPAYMSVREILTFPDYSLTPESCSSRSRSLRKEKARLIAKLKEDMQTKKLSIVHRHFLCVPLPEAHSQHPVDAAATPIHAMNPSIKDKIDELISLGYETRHIVLIVQDYISETLAQSTLSRHSDKVFPSSEEVRDYVYLSAISTPTIVEVQTKDSAGDCDVDVTSQSVSSELKRKVEELKVSLQNCKDERMLKSVKLQTKAIVKKLKVATASQSPRKNAKRATCAPCHCASKRSRILSGANKSNRIPGMSLDVSDQASTERSNCSSNHKRFNHVPNTYPIAPTAADQIPASSHHPHDHTSSTNILASFNRLLESDQDVLPSLVDQVVADSSQFHQAPLSVTPDFISISHLHHE